MTNDIASWSMLTSSNEDELSVFAWRGKISKTALRRRYFSTAGCSSSPVPPSFPRWAPNQCPIEAFVAISTVTAHQDVFTQVPEPMSNCSLNTLKCASCRECPEHVLSCWILPPGCVMRRDLRGWNRPDIASSTSCAGSAAEVLFSACQKRVCGMGINQNHMTFDGREIVSKLTCPCFSETVTHRVAMVLTMPKMESQRFVVA